MLLLDLALVVVVVGFVLVTIVEVGVDELDVKEFSLCLVCADLLCLIGLITPLFAAAGVC